MNLEQSIADICEKHGVLSITINVTPDAAENYRVTAYVHPAPGKRCSTGHGATVAQAIGAALVSLRSVVVDLSNEPIILDEAP